jgi:hypothetical protein
MPSLAHRILYLCEGFSIFLPLAAVVFIDDFIRLVCPKDIILESLTTKGIAIALVGAIVPFILMSVIIARLNLQFILVKKRPSGPFSVYTQPTSETAGKAPILAHSAFAVFVLSSLIVAYGASFFYYVNPQNIVINNGFFGVPDIYGWSDITSIQESCTLQNHTMDTPSFEFDVTLSDGRTFSVTADDEVAKMARLIKSKKGAATPPDPIAYSYSTDSSGSGICPKTFDLSFPAANAPVTP